MIPTGNIKLTNSLSNKEDELKERFLRLRPSNVHISFYIHMCLTLYYNSIPLISTIRFLHVDLCASLEAAKISRFE